MQSFREIINRIRAWPLWHALRRTPAAPDQALILYTSRPILREVSAAGVRVYSLCGCCGAQLAASATLCDGCARSRSAPNA